MCVRYLGKTKKEALFVAYTGLHADASKTLNNVISTLQAKAALGLAPPKKYETNFWPAQQKQRILTAEATNMDKSVSTVTRC